MKIPEDRKPFEVTINGVKKTYEAGATVADDAAVKEIIDNGDLFPPEALPVDTPFPIPEQSGGTEVIANPTLAGDEDSLTGIQIGDTKYAVGGGGGGGVLIVNADWEGTGALDHTWKEINDAGFAVLADDISRCPLVTIGVAGNVYGLSFKNLMDGNEDAFVTDNENGYPVLYAGT